MRAVDIREVKQRLAAGRGGYEVVHSSPGLELGGGQAVFVPAGADHRFTRFPQLSVLAVFAGASGGSTGS
jgi:hypothetical protein